MLVLFLCQILKIIALSNFYCTVEEQQSNVENLGEISSLLEILKTCREWMSYDISIAVLSKQMRRRGSTRRKKDHKPPDEEDAAPKVQDDGSPIPEHGESKSTKKKVVRKVVKKSHKEEGEESGKVKKVKKKKVKKVAAPAKDEV